MQLQSRWTLWTEADTEQQAAHVLERLTAAMRREAQDVRYQPDREHGGMIVRFGVTHADAAWNDLVVDVIALAQQVGQAWTLTGSVFLQAEGLTRDVHVEGVTAASWCIERT